MSLARYHKRLHIPVVYETAAIFLIDFLFNFHIIGLEQGKDQRTRSTPPIIIRTFRPQIRSMTTSARGVDIQVNEAPNFPHSIFRISG